MATQITISILIILYALLVWRVGGLAARIRKLEVEHRDMWLDMNNAQAWRLKDLAERIRAIERKNACN